MSPRRRRYRGPLMPRIISVAVLTLIALAFARAGVRAYRDLPAILHPRATEAGESNAAAAEPPPATIPTPPAAASALRR